MLGAAVKVRMYERAAEDKARFDKGKAKIKRFEKEEYVL